MATTTAGTLTGAVLLLAIIFGWPILRRYNVPLRIHEHYKLNLSPKWRAERIFSGSYLLNDTGFNFSSTANSLQVTTKEGENIFKRMELPIPELKCNIDGYATKEGADIIDSFICTLVVRTITKMYSVPRVYQIFDKVYVEYGDVLYTFSAKETSVY